MRDWLMQPTSIAKLRNEVKKTLKINYLKCLSKSSLSTGNSQHSHLINWMCRKIMLLKISILIKTQFQYFLKIHEMFATEHNWVHNSINDLVCQGFI